MRAGGDECGGGGGERGPERVSQVSAVAMMVSAGQRERAR